jgi:dihydrofolate synthase/folylpolyglutamate synthase
MLGNKDARGFFAGFSELGPKVLTIGFDAEAAAYPGALAEAARAAGLEALACSGLDAAMDEALAGEDPPPHLLICGSLYLAGEVLGATPATWPR